MKQQILSRDQELLVGVEQSRPKTGEDRKRALRPLSLRPARSLVRTKSLRPRTVETFLPGQKGPTQDNLN